MSASKTTAAKTPVAKAGGQDAGPKDRGRESPGEEEGRRQGEARGRRRGQGRDQDRGANREAGGEAARAKLQRRRAPRPRRAPADAPAEEPAKKPAAPRRGNDNALVIVESPAKAKTIKKYLGSGYTVKASVGHVKDLPKKKLGIDIEHGFQPEYVVIDGKKKVLAEIKEAAENATQIFLAPDPDREGEAIAWHIAEEIRPSNPNIHRVLFNEITKKAIIEAIGKPMELDSKKFESQQARRVLDRLVGYQISPVLWTKVRRGSVGGPRAVGGGAPDRRARGRDHGVQAAGVLVGRGERRGQEPAAVHAPRSRASTARRPR